MGFVIGVCGSLHAGLFFNEKASFETWSVGFNWFVMDKKMMVDGLLEDKFVPVEESLPSF